MSLDVRPNVAYFHQEQKEEPQLPPPAAPQASESRWEHIQRNGRAIEAAQPKQSRSQGERRVSSAQAIAGRPEEV